MANTSWLVLVVLAAVGAASLAGALTSCQKSAPPEGPTASRLGAPLSPYGERSAFEKSIRHMPTTRTPAAGSTRAPLQDSYGIITPSSLHFERHHSGVPAIDPAHHRLLIHGMVERPLVFTVEEVKRLPSVTRVHFVECAGNSRSEWGPKTAPDAQQSHGLASCSEWTGALLSELLAEAGVQPGATWVLAEGADPCHMQRSIPLSKVMDDVLVAYGQNGEAIRPEQGYPLRLVVPGWEGNINVKWLRRLKLADLHDAG
jgi:sulfane dehydrogenase subunit SoxC